MTYLRNLSVLRKAARSGWLPLLFSLGLGACLLASCESDSETPTWHEDVAPFVATLCWGCLNNDQTTTTALVEFETVQPLASWMLLKMQGDDSPPYFMPPIGARETDECDSVGTWLDDLRPSRDDIKMFEDWLAAGTPEGDPALAAPLEPTQAIELSGPGIESYTVPSINLSGDAELDQYLCVPIPLDQSEDAWLTELQFLPGNPDLVHHAIVYLDPYGASQGLAGPSGAYPCFGSPGNFPSTVVWGWTSGAQPLVLGDELGTPIPVGANLVVQMHFSPTGVETTEPSTVQVRWSDTPPMKTAEMLVFGGIIPGQVTSQNWADPPFLVPANSKDHVEVWSQELSLPAGADDVRLWAHIPHMHFAGVDIRISLERGSQDLCLSHTPLWDFNWARGYMYEGTFDELPRLREGDRVVIRCTYDNSVDNPILMANSGEESIADITMGEGAFDEMCMAILGFAY